MRDTKNCIVCARKGRRVSAVAYSGFVLLLTDERREEVLAGFCWRHRDVELPHLRHVSGKRGCLGIWMPDYGIK